MVRLLKQNLLLLGILLALTGAFLFPGPGKALKALGMVNGFIFFIFFCQGAGLSSSRLQSPGTILRSLAWGFVLSQVIAPIVAVLCCRALGWTGDDYVGFILICAAAPTLVSGPVLAGRWGGDPLVSLSLSAGLNLASVVTFPIILQLTLGADSAIDTLGLALDLALLVLLPALIGFGAFRKIPGFRRSTVLGFLIKHVPTAALCLIIYSSMCSHHEALTSMNPLRFASFIPPSAFVHGLLLAIGYFVAKHLLSIEETAVRSIAMVCAQKTLTVPISVWTLIFAHSRPFALISLVAFHITQIVFDSVFVGVSERSRIAGR
jgi:predicted Na+-dependent transporter